MQYIIIFIKKGVAMSLYYEAFKTLSENNWEFNYKIEKMFNTFLYGIAQKIFYSYKTIINPHNVDDIRQELWNLIIDIKNKREHISEKKLILFGSTRILRKFIKINTNPNVNSKKPKSFVRITNSREPMANEVCLNTIPDKSNDMKFNLLLNDSMKYLEKKYDKIKTLAFYQKYFLQYPHNRLKKEFKHPKIKYSSLEITYFPKMKEDLKNLISK